MTLKNKQLATAKCAGTINGTLRKNCYGCNEHKYLKYLNIYKAG